MTRSGEPEFSYSRVQPERTGPPSPSGCLHPGGLLFFCEVRTRVGKLAIVAADIGRVTQSAGSPINRGTLCAFNAP